MTTILRRKNKCLLAFTILILTFSSQTAYGQTVKKILPDDVKSTVEKSKNGKPLVIHYTSDDGSCSYCVDNIKTFKNAAESLSESYDFATVILNPWRRYFDSEEGAKIVEYQKSIHMPLTLVNSDFLAITSNARKDAVCTLRVES